ncbi:hypothetical protein TCELL_0112 [Thermogladius calderae 1633]|uniref:Exosortase/archaeosortase family protein n=1 Tax=Thermogladius calderae (strain DSM 22663 / VKM B-2946 / 1633) TaxID=1184251 RepID=I3TCP9_THEC1|nr:hypothetical protein [Thermogladius calderae]AFK50537.1 hypothetical protein TCELL_0112 [Thermogladius calderae 1633]
MPGLESAPPDTTSRRAFFIGLTGLAGIVALLISTLYRDYVRDVAIVILGDVHSYLLIALGNAVLVLYLALRDEVFRFEVSVSKVLATLLLVLFSVFFYLVAPLVGEYTTFYRGLSFSLLVFSTLLFIFTPTSTRALVPYLLVLLLTPIPASSLDNAAQVFSRAAGEIAAGITGSTFNYGDGFGQITVHTSYGPVEVPLVSIRLGYTPLTSTIALLPVVLWVVSRNTLSLRRKSVLALLSVAVGLLIGFVGEMLRAVVLVEAVRYEGIPLAWGALSYTPTIIYVAASSIFAVYLVSGSFISDTPGSKEASRGKADAGVRAVTGLVLLLLLAFTTLVAVLSPINTSWGYTITSPGVSAWDFVSRPENYIFAGFKIESAWSDPATAGLLGVLNVRHVTFSSNKASYHAVVEVAETPTLLHAWNYDLSLEGYSVVRSWVQDVNGVHVYLVQASKWNTSCTIAAALLPVLIRDRSTTSQLYVRVYLVPGETSLESTVAALEAIKRVLDSQQFTPPSVAGLLDTLGVLLKLGVFATVAYYLFLAGLKTIPSRPLKIFRTRD